MSPSAQAILCVDDERIVLLSLRDQINKHFGNHYRYEVAESADEAWEVIEELCQDDIKLLLIVSDWLMPGMRGDEFLIAVQQRFPGIIERARQEAKLHAYIAKPWTEENLIQVIQSGLETFNG
jgi:CheY-like chemotaxis protein